MKRRTLGFTLIELLVVIGIVGIIIGIGTPNYIRSYRASQLSQSVQEFTSQVDQTRAQARRVNRCYRLTVLGGTDAAYRIDKYKTSNCTGVSTDVETSRTYPMGSGTQMKVATLSSANTDKIDFRPPYGHNSTGLPIDLQIEHLGDSDVKKDVRVTGVMGTVVIK